MDKPTLNKLQEKLAGLQQQLSRYKLILFLAFIAIIYVFMLYRIDTFNSAEPSTDAIAAQNNPIKAARVDKSVVKKLQSLQDNSVNVHSLFDQARNNPFQE